jgi:parvulin-like peptidyl-prolyl isomerase
LSHRAQASRKRTYPWSGLDDESRSSFLLTAGIAGAIIFAILFIGYGYYTQRLAPDRATVIEVGERNYPYEYVERRARAELAGGRLDVADLGNSLYAMMERIQREEVLRISAASEGITVSEEELEERYRTKLGMAPEASREDFARRLRSELLRSGLTLTDYKEIAQAEVIERKLRAKYGDAIPASAEQVDLQLMQLGTQAEALKAKDRLAAGDTFGVIAVDSSTYAGAETNAGDLSWTPREALPKALADIVFGMQVGQTSDMIEIDDGFFFVKVNGKETREVSSDTKNRAVEQQLSTLVNNTKEDIGSEIVMTTNQVQRLALALQTVGV